MDLRDYEEKKFAIAQLLRDASHLVPQDQSESRARLQDLFARLAEDRFNLVVVGRFSRGKTSLMNAILGTDRLPTGIAPLTSVITTVTYGSREQVVLKYENKILDKEIPIESLPHYITQQGNPGNVQRIKTAEIRLPAEMLRRGFYFVDTPGLGSVIVENTLTTEAFLPEADAFLLVTSYESPLSEEEMQFFKAASSSRKRIFVVINKHDTVSPDDREDVGAFVREQLQAIFGRSAPLIFSVSSLHGLQAKRACDQQLLAGSGIPELENALVSFLLKEKSAEFLLRMCDRIREFIWEVFRPPESKALIDRVTKLVRDLGSADVAEADLAEPPVRQAALSNLHQIQSCEICAHIAERLWDFLCRYQYDLTVDHDQQARFAERGGFCPFHTWQYEAIASPYGICTSYPVLLDRFAAVLRQAASTDPTRTPLRTALRQLMPTEKDCILCEVRNAAEQEVVVATAQKLSEDEARAENAGSAFCFPHFAMLVATISDEAIARKLVERQAAVLQRFSEDMRRYALKHDAARRYLASKEETVVAERGLLAVAGRQRVNFRPATPASSGMPVRPVRKLSRASR
jgi:small GTP-binding protein